MAAIVVFTQEAGPETVYVSDDSVEWWLEFWARQGCPAVRAETYRRRGFFPATDDDWGVTLRPNPQRSRR
jgi:hypothetical protein